MIEFLTYLFLSTGIFHAFVLTFLVVITGRPSRLKIAIASVAYIFLMATNAAIIAASMSGEF